MMSYDTNGWIAGLSQMIANADLLPGVLAIIGAIIGLVVVELVIKADDLDALYVKRADRNKRSDVDIIEE